MKRTSSNDFSGFGSVLIPFSRYKTGLMLAYSPVVRRSLQFFFLGIRISVFVFLVFLLVRICPSLKKKILEKKIFVLFWVVRVRTYERLFHDNALFRAGHWPHCTNEIYEPPCTHPISS